MNVPLYLSREDRLRIARGLIAYRAACLAQGALQEVTEVTDLAARLNMSSPQDVEDEDDIIDAEFTRKD